MREPRISKRYGLAQLMQIKGIGKVKAIQIKAVCEISLRMTKCHLM